MLFISSKKLFWFSRYSNFCISSHLSSPLFLPVSHCFRGWSKINLKVCEAINCLNQNLITHFVWYGIETLSIDRVLNKEHVYWKIMQKIFRGPFLILINNPKKPLHARNSFKNKIFERGLSKSRKKVNFFPFEPSPF